MHVRPCYESYDTKYDRKEFALRREVTTRSSVRRFENIVRSRAFVIRSGGAENDGGDYAAATCLVSLSISFFHDRNICPRALWSEIRNIKTRDIRS